MNYENYSTNTAPPLPIKTYTSAPPDYTDVAPIKSSNGNDKDRSSKASAHQLNLNAGPWLLRRTSIHVSSEAAEPFDNDKESISQLSIATSKRSDKESGLRRKLFKQGHVRNQESVGDARSASTWQHTEAFDTGFGTKVSIEAGRPNKNNAERHYDMKGLEQAASVKRWGGGGKPGEAWGKLQKVCHYET